MKNFSTVLSRMNYSGITSKQSFFIIIVLLIRFDLDLL